MSVEPRKPWDALPEHVTRQLGIEISYNNGGSSFSQLLEDIHNVYTCTLYSAKQLVSQEWNVKPSYIHV